MECIGDNRGRKGGGGRPAFYEGKSHKKEDWILQNIQRIMKEGGSVNL